MQKVLSSGQSTQLHSFPTLETVCTYPHTANEDEDFNFFTDRSLFLAINKKSGFELLRTTQNKDGEDVIQRCKKRQLNDLYCGASSKLETGYAALGFTNGNINFFSIHSGEFSDIKFKPEKAGNGVICLEYNNCDDILASVYENGDVCLYGLTTHIKMASFQPDKSSTQIRFHPTKRFNLAISSYLGAVTVYDVQTKRTIFHDKNAHNTCPCPDLFWSPIQSDILCSVGYDCHMKVYDIRRRHIVTEVKHQHPYSTVALSKCGNFCVAGNLKGDVIAYDFRNLKSVLASKRAHKSNVVRVAFVPDNLEKINYTNTIQEHCVTMSPEKAEASSVKDIDSFDELIEKCKLKKAHNEPSRAHRRSSIFDMDFFPTKPQDFSSDSIDVTSNRLSVGEAGSSTGELRLKRNSVSRLSRLHVEGAVHNPAVLSPIVMEENVFMSDSEQPIKAELAHKQAIKRRAMGPEEISRSSFSGKSTDNELRPPSKLSGRKSCGPKISMANYDATRFSDIIENDKENQNSFASKKDIEMFGQFLSENHGSSTPNILKQKKPDCGGEQCAKRMQQMEQNLLEKMEKLQINVSNEFQNQSLVLLSHLWSMTEVDIAEIKQGVMSLMRNDDFVQDYIRLKVENEELKKIVESQNQK